MHNYTFIISIYRCFYAICAAVRKIFMSLTTNDLKLWANFEPKLKLLWLSILLALNLINGTLQHFVGDTEIHFICNLQHLKQTWFLWHWNDRHGLLMKTQTLHPSGWQQHCSASHGKNTLLLAAWCEIGMSLSQS